MGVCADQEFVQVIFDGELARDLAHVLVHGRLQDVVEQLQDASLFRLDIHVHCSQSFIIMKQK